LASAYNDLGEFEKAVKYYKLAISLDETNVDAYLCLGGAYESLKIAEKAANAYQYALRVDP
jgi:tetratricopeptide (TPR) repeat protein